MTEKTNMFYKFADILEKMNVVIIKYNAGNIRSVDFALKRLGVEAEVTDEYEKILRADRVIFPGVGEASTAMQYLQSKNLDSLIKQLKQPTLGICLGMQLMCTQSEEGNTDCLGIFDLKVKKFVDSDLKIPQVGWNDIYQLRSPLFKELSAREYVYFVHGYYVEKCSESIALVDYGIEYSAAIAKNNFLPCSFIPKNQAIRDAVFYKIF